MPTPKLLGYAFAFSLLCELALWRDRNGAGALENAVHVVTIVVFFAACIEHESGWR